MTALAEIETHRDEALAELKSASLELQQLRNDEDEFLKKNRKDRFEVEKKKARIGGRVQVYQLALDRIEKLLPAEVSQAVSALESKIKAHEFELSQHRRDLQGRKFELEAMRKKGARGAELSEIMGLVNQLESTIDGLEVDVEEEKKGLEAARILRRESLESLKAEAEEELEKLRVSVGSV